MGACLRSSLTHSRGSLGEPLLLSLSMPWDLGSMGTGQWTQCHRSNPVRDIQPGVSG